MVDREKVIKGLECCTQHGSMCGHNCNGYWGYTDASHTRMELIGEYRTGCTYGSCETGCVKTLAKDALTLLKSQEPVEPKYDPDDDDWAHCGHCGARLYERWVGANYCAFCGRAVKWE